MEPRQLANWLRRMRIIAGFASVAAACLGVAMLVIGLIPKSPVTLDLPATLLTGLESVRGVARGLALEPASTVTFRISDPSFAQRMIFLATVLPGLLLVMEIARRMARLLRAAEETDPFTARTATDLVFVAKLTAAGGVAVWAAGVVANWGLARTMLSSSTKLGAHSTPLGWLAVGLIFAAFAQLIRRGVALRTELDTVI